jgi:hypothetical protein
VIADLPDLEEVFDFELVDRVEGHARGSSSIVPDGKRFNLGSILPDELHGARYGAQQLHHSVTWPKQTNPLRADMRGWTTNLRSNYCPQR